jgi:hypothetical protein
MPASGRRATSGIAPEALAKEKKKEKGNILAEWRNLCVIPA